MLTMTRTRISSVPLLFTEEDANDFLNHEPSVAYDPNFHQFEGKLIVVHDLDVVKVLDDHRYLVMKKWA